MSFFPQTVTVWLMDVQVHWTPKHPSLDAITKRYSINYSSRVIQNSFEKIDETMSGKNRIDLKLPDAKNNNSKVGALESISAPSKINTRLRPLISNPSLAITSETLLCSTLFSSFVRI